MASIAATAFVFGTSDTMPRAAISPRLSSTLAIPIAVTSSHQRERSVSMMMRGTAFAALVAVPWGADAEAAEGTTIATMTLAMMLAMAAPQNDLRCAPRSIVTIAPPCDQSPVARLFLSGLVQRQWPAHMSWTTIATRPVD